MLSDRGSITIDERTNSLLIRELEENIAVIRGIIESLDIPVKQVQIEARIVTVTEVILMSLAFAGAFPQQTGASLLAVQLKEPPISDYAI